MNSEILGWLITILLVAIVLLIMKVTWIIAVEHGFDQGFKSGYERGRFDSQQKMRWRDQASSLFDGESK